MLEIKNLSIKYVEDFFSIYNLNLKITNNTLFLEDCLDGGYALMRAIANIEKNYKGEIVLNGKNIKNISNKNLNLAYVPPSPVLFKNLTAKKNIIYPLKLRKIDKKIQNNLLTQLLTKYKISFGEFKAKNLSNSQGKIVTLLRAIIRKPDIILIEHFFEGLEDDFVPLANQIIDGIPANTLVIACEKSTQLCFQNYTKYILNNGSLFKK